MWVTMKRGGQELTPEHVSTVLGRYNDEAVQSVLDLWSDFDAQLDPDLASGDINQILGEQVVSAAAEAKAEVDKLYGSKWLGKAAERASSAKSHPTNVERVMRMGNTIENTDEFIEMLPEVAGTAEHAMSLRDPEVRRTLGQSEMMMATDSARRLTNDITAAKTLFDQLRASGVDPAPLEGVLREQLDKYEMGDLLSVDAYPPVEMRNQADRALLEFRNVEDTGKPAEREAIAVVDQIAASMANSSSASGHGTYASIVNQVAEYQRGHGGVSEPLAEAIRAASEHDRFGFLTSTLTDLEVDVAIKDGDAEAVSDLTGGKKSLVTWSTETTLSPDLTVDDRTGGDRGEITVKADFMFREGLAEITPNVAAALNSMYAAYGGGIHRTNSNVTEASTNYAASINAQGLGAVEKKQEGEDQRTPEETTGHYVGSENNLVVADDTYNWTDSVTNTLTHELGHALDSMLGEVAGSGSGRGFYSDNNPEFLALRTQLQEIASYGDDPNATVLNWYYRNNTDGAGEHNGYAGTTEMWAQGYAAYAAMRRMLANPEEGRGGQEWQNQVFRKGGGSLLHGHTSGARDAGVPLKEVFNKNGEAGQAIYEFFDDFENRVLPELMKNPVVVTKRWPTQSRVAEALGAPPPPSNQHTPNAVQTQRASGHRYNGTPLDMAEIKPGDQNYDSVIDAMKERNPGFTGPSPQALGVWYNRDWASAEDGTLLMKVIMPGNDDPTNVYDYKHSKKSNAQKFQREQAVHKVHKPLREKSLNEAMDDPIAAMVATMIDSGMRVDDAKGKNRTKSVKRKKVEQVIGASSLMPKHLTFNENGTVRIDFMGKSGVDNRYTVKDPRLVAALKKWSEGKGPNEFIFGNTNADQSIEYLRDATGIADMINHDLRTYMANAVVFQWLEGLPGFKKTKGKTAKQIRDDPNPARPKKGMSAEEFEKFKVKGWQQAAMQLNDGWTTVRDNYVSPYVWYSLEHDLDLPHSWDELITFTGVPEHPGPTNVPAPPTNVPGGPTNVPGGPTNVPVEGGPRPEPVAAAATPAEDEAIESAEPTTPVDFSDAAYRALDEFYGSAQWAGLDPATPPPAPMFAESLPPGDEVE